MLLGKIVEIKDRFVIDLPRTRIAISATAKLKRKRFVDVLIERFLNEIREVIILQQDLLETLMTLQ